MKIDKLIDSIDKSVGSIAKMTPGQINKSLDRADQASELLTDVFIEVGRGSETPSETMMGVDPLSRQYQRLVMARSILTDEISRRYGPGAPRRLPTR